MITRRVFVSLWLAFAAPKTREEYLRERIRKLAAQQRAIGLELRWIIDQMHGRA